MAWYSAPMTLLWVLVIALVVFGTVDHLMWVAAGVLAAATAGVEYLLARRRRAARLRAAASRRA